MRPSRPIRLYRVLLDNCSPEGGQADWWPIRSAFEMAVSAVLVQHSRWNNAARAVQCLVEADALTPETLLTAPQATLSEWIRPAGCQNVKAGRLRALCHWWQKYADSGLGLEELRASLLRVYGVGEETADAILLYGFHLPTFVVDNYTRRLLLCLGWSEAGESGPRLRSWFLEAVAADVDVCRRFHGLIVDHAKSQGCPRSDCPAGGCCLGSLRGSG